jgi:hypothetical protein
VRAAVRQLHRFLPAISITEKVEMRGLLIGLMLTLGVTLGVYATAAGEVWAALPAGALLMFVIYLSTGRRDANS